MRIQIITKTLISALLLSLTACQYGGRYNQRHDSAPTQIPESIARDNAIPHYEPYREHNSRPYVVFGKQYFPLSTGKGFVEEGEASWYGQKFHGHLTSNGEVYDMYGMTAAHKTLPLPSFVRVTNTINNKSVIVRVNDRGPFHGNRIIDLSFAAAKQLDYLATGTAPVKVEVIHFDEKNRVTVGDGPTVSYAEYAGLIPPKIKQEPTTHKDPEPIAGFFIQVAALSDSAKITNLSEALSELYQIPASIEVDENINRLRLGPIHSEHIADLLLDELRQNGYPGAFTVSAP